MKNLSFFLLLMAAMNVFGQNQKSVVFTKISITNVNCKGEIIIAASGGSGLYLYSDDGGKNNFSSNVFTNLAPGQYRLKITDKNNSKLQRDSTVTVPSIIPISVTCTHTNLTCYGNATGTAAVKVLDTTFAGSYTYQWSDNGPAVASRTGLAAGNYYVTVTDRNGCKANCEDSITQPDTLILNVTGQNASCTSNSGSVFVTATGGSQPYSYLWNDGATLPSRNGLASGMYTITLTDGNRCTASGSITLAQTGSSTPIYHIGDKMPCGWVFYIDTTGDSAHLCMSHYLICASQDQSSGTTWYNSSSTDPYTLAGATNNFLFDIDNATILTQGNFSDAAASCAAYKTDSCPSWYLPCVAELQLMYTNLAANGIGGFANEGYWSSVESSTKKHSAYIIDFYNGKKLTNDKSNKYPVRAVTEMWIKNK